MGAAPGGEMPGPTTGASGKRKGAKRFDTQFEPKYTKPEPQWWEKDPEWWPGSYKDRRCKLEWALDHYMPEQIIGKAEENIRKFLERGQTVVTPLTGLRLCRLTFLVKQMKKLSAFKKIQGWDQDLHEWRGHKDHPLDDLLHEAWVKVITKFPNISSTHQDFAALNSQLPNQAAKQLVTARFQSYFDTAEKVVECVDELAQVYPAYEMLLHHS